MLIETIEADIKSAMLARQGARLECLRSLKAALVKGKTSADKELTADEEIAILKTVLKQRVEAGEAFGLGGNLSEQLKEEAEYDIILTYLPQILSKDELPFIIELVMDEQTADLKEGQKLKMGDVMKGVAKAIASTGKIADNKEVSEAVRAALAK